MLFQVISHAGLRVACRGKELLTDPWIVGSCYWRSWWNYPPVAPELVASLKPDLIYLTHIHWDHFQSVSLRRFDRQTPIVIPWDRFDRMYRDLKTLGFGNIARLRHGERLVIADDFAITSDHFSPYTDSALVIEGEGYTLLNANDAKFMGLPLKQIIDRHPGMHFVFRSHSSANNRVVP